MAKNNRKIIISCAITGSVHTPTMSEYLPASPTQIVDSAVEAAEAGAAILHIHARKDEDGGPREILRTTGRSVLFWRNVQTRSSTSRPAAARICRLSNGSPIRCRPNRKCAR